MTGFVGTRARRRRRKTIFYSIFFVIVILIIFYLPLIDFSSNVNPIPDDNIFPDLEKDTIIENTTLEDLQLLLFQKDQKIKFRDGRIISLQSELKKLENIYENLNLQYKNIEKKYNNYIKQQNSKKTIEVDPNKINDLQSKISNLQSKNEKNQNIYTQIRSKCPRNFSY